MTSRAELGNLGLGNLELSDPRVPGVALIGDSSALARLLAGAGEQLLDRGYLRYKPGTSLIAGLRLTSGPAFAYAVSAEARPKLAKLIERAPEGAVLVNAAAVSVLIARPSADRDLPALADPDRLSAAVGRRTTSWTTLAYKPQRRWVGRPNGEPCDAEQKDAEQKDAGQKDAGQEPMLRAYRPGELPEAMTGWRLAERLAGAHADVRLPTARTVSARRGLAAVSWLPGTPLDRLSAAGSSSRVLADVGAALARVHDSLPPRPGDTVLDVRASRPVLTELAAVLPTLRRRLASLLRALEAQAPRPATIHPVHGDFSADQVIVARDGGIGIADWDRAGWGDPGSDLGSLRAAGLSETAYAAVLGGYATVRAVPTSTEWHCLVAVVQRLTEPLRCARTDWRSEIADRLEWAESHLGDLATRGAGTCAG